MGAPLELAAGCALSHGIGVGSGVWVWTGSGDKIGTIFWLSDDWISLSSSSSGSS